MKTRLDIKDRDPVLTAVVGDNSDLIKNIADLYIPNGVTVLDATYGKGVFWKDVNTDRFDLITNDIEWDKGEHSYDFTDTLPWDNETIDVVVFDPPYIFGAGGVMPDAYDRQYENTRYRQSGSKGVKSIVSLYHAGMSNLYETLKPGGLMWVKTMDLISSGKQHRVSMMVWDIAVNELDMTDEDQFILVQNGNPIMRHQYQLHARKNNSFLWVFRK